MDLEIVIPVYNEEADLALSVLRLHDHLDSFPFSYRITIADNASVDRSWNIAQQLERLLEHVRAVHLEEKGRGRALRAVWQASDATVVAYMDVDLSTDLAALLPLVAPLLSGHSEIAIGTRLTRDSRVVRGRKRELISRSYNLLLQVALRARFSDAQCGFKAIRSDCARSLLPLVEDTGWFFDTELLVLAERAGLRIHEVPVDWVEDPDSRVDIIATAVGDLRGVRRVAWGTRMRPHPACRPAPRARPPTRDRERGQAAPRPRAPPPPPLLTLAASPQGAPPMSATITAAPQTPAVSRVDSTRTRRPQSHGGRSTAPTCGARRAARGDRCPVSLEPLRLRLRQRLLRRRRAGGHALLEGLLLRLASTPHNFITVDKPPASLWVMELSGRIFGFSAGACWLPQALEGVAAVALLYAAVRRIAGATAGLAAGAMLALTPVAALMFRFNNPDALLTLLLVARRYACCARSSRPARAGCCWPARPSASPS